MKNRFKFRCWIDNEQNEDVQEFINEHFDDISFLKHCQYYIYSNILWGNEIVTHLENIKEACGLNNDEFRYYRRYLAYKTDNYDYVWLKDGIIEQCTSEKDKNDNLIYEGDIVKYKDTLYVVKWDTNFNRFEAMSKYCSGYVITSTFTRQCEIVGNIHEDREFYESNH